MECSIQSLCSVDSTEVHNGKNTLYNKIYRNNVSFNAGVCFVCVRPTLPDKLYYVVTNWMYTQPNT